MSLSRKERQQLKREEQTSSSVPAPSSPAQIATPKKNRLWKYIGIGAVVFLLLIAVAVAYHLHGPGPYDSFAKCLEEKGATMYGAMGWCKYTQGQKAMFGKSFRYISYHEFGDYPAEQYGKIKTTPTWIIDGKTYENAQSFEDLSRLTGCPLS